MTRVWADEPGPSFSSTVSTLNWEGFLFSRRRPGPHQWSPWVATLRASLAPHAGPDPKSRPSSLP